MPKNTTQCPRPGLEPGTARSGVERTNHEATAPPKGRKSGGYELIGSWNKIEQTESSFPKQRLAELLKKSTACEEPCGRQHAKAVELDSKHLFIFGGETWTGVRENVTNDAFILESDRMRWYKLPVGGNAPKLVGHSMVGTGDKIFVFGGGVGNKYCDNLWEVKI